MKDPEAKKRRSLLKLVTVGCGAQRHTKNPCLLNPPGLRRRGGGREGGKERVSE